MAIRVVGRAIISLIFLSLLSACGDMESMFPSGNNYRVRANVNGVSLEEDSSILRSGDRISPYFAVSVESDPDITGLLVYLRNWYGEIVGHRIRYVLGIPNGETAETEPANENETDADAQPETSDSEIEIAVRSFGQELPDFPLSESMEIGQHTLVFEVLGGRTTLRRTEIPVFYIGNAEFTLKDISMSLPWLFGSRLVPPGTKVLLEARLNFDSRLDPYLIWHSGRNIIHTGRVREGAGSVLWEAPSQAAFHPLRLEILPYPPLGLRRNLLGISRKILLPVSANANTIDFFFEAGPGYAARNRLAEGMFHLERINIDPLEENCDDVENSLEPPELRRWYQFKGRLHDTISTQDEERFLIPADEHIPRWTSMGQSYGLSTCNDHTFLLSPVDFFREGQDHGGGIFLFHVRPIAEGTIFSVFFPAYLPAGGAWIDLSRSGDAIVLRIGTAETTIEMPIFLTSSELRALIPVAVKFYIHPDRMEANLSIGENAFLQSTVQGVPLSDALTGEGVIRLGGVPLDSWSRAPAQIVTSLVYLPYAPWEDPADMVTPPVPDIDADSPATYWEELGEALELQDDFTADFPTWDQTEDPRLVGVEIIGPSVTTIWNEFAVLLSSTPFPRLEFLAEEVSENEEHNEAEETARTQNDAVPAIANPENENKQKILQIENGSMIQDFAETETLDTEVGATPYENIDADTEPETFA